jgi:hypothetical protein
MPEMSSVRPAPTDSCFISSKAPSGVAGKWILWRSSKRLAIWLKIQKSGFESA